MFTVSFCYASSAVKTVIPFVELYFVTAGVTIWSYRLDIGSDHRYLDILHGLRYSWNLCQHQITRPNDCLTDYSTNILFHEWIPSTINIWIYIYIYICLYLHMDSDIFRYFLDITFANILRWDTYLLHLRLTVKYGTSIVCAMNIVLCKLAIHILFILFI